MTSPAIDLQLDGDGCWPDLADRTIRHAGSALAMAVLPEGMASGLASVTFRIDLPDSDESVIVETSLRALTVAVRAANARYPDPERVHV